jgi:hypothetical protein
MSFGLRRFEKCLPKCGRKFRVTVGSNNSAKVMVAVNVVKVEASKLWSVNVD